MNEAKRERKRNCGRPACRFRVIRRPSNSRTLKYPGRYGNNVFALCYVSDDAVSEARDYARHNPDDVFEVWDSRQEFAPVFIVKRGDE